VNVLDLTPAYFQIVFFKGSNLNPIFFCLDDDLTVIDLTEYSAQMQARLKDDDDEVLTGFDLTTANGGLEIVQTDVTLADGTLVEQAWGVALKVSYTVTQAIDWTKALFSIDIENDGVVTPIAMGELLPKEQATRWQAP